MKITAVDTYLVSPGSGPVNSWLFVQIHTDEGITGSGEGGPPGQTKITQTAINELGRYLIGQDPVGIEGHWQAMYRGTSRYRGGAIRQSAIGAVDMALWDIQGQRLGVPIYNLLGGPYRTRVRAYANHWDRGCKTPAQFADVAKGVVEQGYTALKFSPWGELGQLTEKEILRGADRIMDAVRSAVGPDVDLAIECAERFVPRTAIEAARVIAPYGIFFMEEPVTYENVKAMALVARSIEIPVAAGERLFSRFEFREPMELQSIAIAQPDTMNAGGITEVRKIASLVETYQVQIAPHNPSGPFQCLAALQLAAICPNFLILETSIPSHSSWRVVASTPPEVDGDGYFSIPTAAGLGSHLLVDGVKKLGYLAPSHGSHIQFRE